MWLLDANMDIHVIPILQEFGIESQAATRHGWQGLTNGKLVKTAFEAGFRCVLTHDRLFAEAAGRALKAYPEFSVVVVHLPQKPWKNYQEDFRTAWGKNAIKPSPGQVIDWPPPSLSD